MRNCYELLFPPSAKTIDQLLKLPFDNEEEAILERYLQESSEPNSQELLIMHYLQRARYVEAIRMNEKLKQQGLMVNCFLFFFPLTFMVPVSHQWTLPMKYANYIHACLQTLMVGKRPSVVHKADSQSCLRHAAISRVQNSTMFPHFANQNVSARTLSAINIFVGRVFCMDNAGRACSGLTMFAQHSEQNTLFHPAQISKYCPLCIDLRHS